MDTTKAIQVLLHMKVKLLTEALKDPDNRALVTANTLDARLIDEALRDLGYTGLHTCR